MNHPILDDGLCTPDGRSLAWADNAHLLHWPGELVYGEPLPVATDQPEQFEDRKKDWDYDSDRERPRRREKRSPVDVPDQPLNRLRRLLSNGRPEAAEPGPHFARPDQASAFAMQQGHLSRSALLDELECRVLLGDWPMGGETPLTFYAGAQTVLDALATDFFNEPIIPPVLLNAIGPRRAGEVLAGYMGSPHAQEIVRRWRDGTWRTIDQRLDEKLQLCQESMFSWAAAGQKPVLSPEGEPDAILTLASAATATVAVYHLANLGQALKDFQKSGRDAIAGVLDSLPSPSSL